MVHHLQHRSHSICMIYTAVHPNIPSPKYYSTLLILRRRLGIVIMALITPELVVTWAMRQWISAHRVTRQFKESGFSKISQPQGQARSESFYLMVTVWISKN
ncbi:hypothetical protein BDR04DRAFT_690962 [Suillus decipiens]|nr:hypothetical protein BDR04DRAFT_690962 [Suillus decipiens]